MIYGLKKGRNKDNEEIDKIFGCLIGCIERYEDLTSDYDSMMEEGDTIQIKRCKSLLNIRARDVDILRKSYNEELEKLSFEEKCITPIVYFSPINNCYTIETPSYYRDEIDANIKNLSPEIREEFEKKLAVLDELNSKYEIGFSAGVISFEGISNDKGFMISNINAEEIHNSYSRIIDVDFETGEYRCESKNTIEDGKDESIIDKRLTDIQKTNNIGMEK